MTFSAAQLPYVRLNYMTYYASAAAAGASMFEDLNLSQAFELDRIHLRLPSAVGSVVDFMIHLSHRLGSHFDQNILSQAMNGTRDVLYQADPTVRLHWGDTIHFSLVASNNDNWGLEVGGWAITQAPRG